MPPLLPPPLPPVDDELAPPPLLPPQAVSVNALKRVIYILYIGVLGIICS